MGFLFWGQLSWACKHMEKFTFFYFPSKCFVSFNKDFFFPVLTLKPSPIILPWHPSKDTDQKAKQGNKVKKKIGPKGLFGGIGFSKHWNSFSKGIFHLVFCCTVGEQLVSSGYKLSPTIRALLVQVTMKAWKLTWSLPPAFRFKVTIREKNQITLNNPTYCAPYSVMCINSIRARNVASRSTSNHQLSGHQWIPMLSSQQGRPNCWPLCFPSSS